MTHRMKMVVAYLGTWFHGWQRQKGERTIQGELERTLSKVTGGLEITVVGAGRTDAGVHAAGQVAHCDLPTGLSAEALARALYGSLPADLRVRSISAAASTFHARRSALGKCYTYRATWRRTGLPWRQLRSARLPARLDLARLEGALELYRGSHDWASFTVPEPGVDSTERVLHRADLRRSAEGFRVDFVGSGFLRYQVRRMMGAALEVAEGRRELDELRRLIESPQPGARIHTAPPEGLCLERVFYRRSPHLVEA